MSEEKEILIEKTEPSTLKRVSFSQFAKWFKCAYQWKLDYADGLRTYEGSIHTCFGTAIHHALQTYLKTLYTEGVSKADALDVIKIFKDKFEEELKNEKNQVKYTEDEFTEFYFDGTDIIGEFLSTANRVKHFPTKKYEFIGVEVPLQLEIKHNVQFVAFVDLILKDIETGSIKIYDFKTSSNGWNSYMKEDESKYSQLLLYKAFYSKQYNVPLNKIEVEFLILKRKLYENVGFPQNRLQRFVPTNTSGFIAKTLNCFSGFISECFTPEGMYNTTGEFPKNPGKNKKNCKWCSHYKKKCDGKES